MKKINYKNKNGKIVSGIYTNSTMPNTDKKRVRHNRTEEVRNYTITFDPFVILPCVYFIFGATNLHWFARLLAIGACIFCMVEIERRD